MRHQSATAHELARIAELAGLPGETLARLGEQMERRELEPGEALDASGRFGVVLSGMVRGQMGLLRPGDTFTESVTALTPATVASCDRAVYESFVGQNG
jgi:CRP-like cAMP-binding protein